jgi:hypothetical protein
MMDVEFYGDLISNIAVVDSPGDKSRTVSADLSNHGDDEIMVIEEVDPLTGKKRTSTASESHASAKGPAQLSVVEGRLLDVVAGATRCNTMQARGSFVHGMHVAVYELGLGRFILNTLNIESNLGKHPAAERLLRNMLNYAAGESKPTSEKPEGGIKP